MIGFIGGGNMAEAIIKGMLQDSKFKIQNKTQEEVQDDNEDKRNRDLRDQNIIVSEPREDRRKYLEKTYGVITTNDNKEVVNIASIIILAVKPQKMDDVLTEIGSFITDSKTVVSIAAGITLSYMQSKLNTSRLIRVMPNTPALVQEGMSVISLCSCLPMDIVAPVRDIFLSIGKVMHLPEKHMDAVTALSGSGPAFIAYFVECLIKAGEKMGLSIDNSSELAIQTLIGTSRLLETGMQPHKLREMVTSPGGTTLAGLRKFEEKGFESIVSEALQSALNRGRELGRR